jgi:hypothetical protein
LRPLKDRIPQARLPKISIEFQVQSMNPHNKTNSMKSWWKSSILDNADWIEPVA